MLTTLSLIFAAGACLVAYVWYTWSQPSVKRPPSPPGNWFFGNLFQFPSSLDFLHLYEKDLYFKYGPLVYLRLGGVHFYLVTGVEHLKQLFYYKAFDQHGDRAFNETIGEYCFIVLRGDRWRLHKKLLVPVLQRDTQIKGYVSLMNSSADDLVDLWKLKASNSESFDAYPYIKNFTLDAFAKAAFDYNMNVQREENTELDTAFSTINEAIKVLNFKPALFLFKLLNPSLMKRVRQSRQILEKLIDKMIDDFNNGKISNNTLVSNFLTASDKETGEKLTPQEIKDELVTFMFGGFETTSNQISWMLYALSMYPDVQQKVADEIQSILGNKSPSYEDIERLPYLNGFVKETQRLYPVANAVARIATEDTELGSYKIPKGSMINVNIWMIHRLKEIWGEDAEEFKPERWLSLKNDDTTDVNRFKFMPFGNGLRKCPGSKFAEVELRLSVVRLLQNFKFRRDESKKFQPSQQIVYGPTELHMFVTKRFE